MERNIKVRFIYSIFLGVFTAVVGVLFLAQAAEIYYSGVAQTGQTQGMYTRALVAARLRPMLFLICLWAVAIVEGLAFYALFPVLPPRAKGPAGDKIYARLKRRISPEKDPGAYRALRRAERIRLCVRILSAAFCLLAAAMCIVYLAGMDNSASLSTLNSDVLSMVKNILPWAGAAFLLLAAEAVFEGLFYKKYLPVVKKLVGGAYTLSRAERCAERVHAAADNKFVLLAVRIALLALGVTLLTLGALNGGARDVLIKAANICTECIGLG